MGLVHVVGSWAPWTILAKDSSEGAGNDPTLPLAGSPTLPFDGSHANGPVLSLCPINICFSERMHGQHADDCGITFSVEGEKFFENRIGTFECRSPDLKLDYKKSRERLSDLF
jgi:hypothetical protein